MYPFCRTKNNITTPFFVLIYRYDIRIKFKKVEGMRKIIMLFSVMICFWTLSGCDRTYSYVGESKHWKGKYIISQTDTSESGEGTIIYKGKDREKINDVKWRVEDNSSKQEGTGFIERGTIQLKSSCSGCAVHDKEEVFLVTIEWDGKKESFEMRYK